MFRTRAQRKKLRQSLESENANQLGEMNDELRANGRKRRRQTLTDPIATKKSNGSDATEVVNSNVKLKMLQTLLAKVVHLAPK